MKVDYISTSWTTKTQETLLEGKFLYPRLHKVFYFLLPARPIHLITIITSLGSIQPHSI